jgi:hypothetical protein
LTLISVIVPFALSATVALQESILSRQSKPIAFYVGVTPTKSIHKRVVAAEETRNTRLAA